MDSIFGKWLKAYSVSHKEAIAETFEVEFISRFGVLKQTKVDPGTQFDC